MVMVGRVLKYFLTLPALVSFDVIDASGKIVRHVDRFKQSEGWHPLPLVSGLSGAIGNGVYLVRCAVDGGSTFVKRAVVLR
jgi:hypothetical protein